MIEALPPLTPDPQKTERTIARCHERLARRRKPVTITDSPSVAYLAVERAIGCGFCVLYISSIALVAIELLGGF